MYVNTLITLQENLSTYGIDGNKVTGHVTFNSPGLIRCYVQNLKKPKSGQHYAFYAFSKAKDKGVRLGVLGENKETNWIVSGKNVEGSGLGLDELDGVAIVSEDDMRGVDTIMMGFKESRYMIIPIIDQIYSKLAKPKVLHGENGTGQSKQEWTEKSTPYEKKVQKSSKTSQSEEQESKISSQTCYQVNSVPSKQESQKSTAPSQQEWQGNPPPSKQESQKSTAPSQQGWQVNPPPSMQGGQKGTAPLQQEWQGNPSPSKQESQKSTAPPQQGWQGNPPPPHKPGWPGNPPPPQQGWQGNPPPPHKPGWAGNPPPPQQGWQGNPPPPHKPGWPENPPPSQQGWQGNPPPPHKPGWPENPPPPQPREEVKIGKIIEPQPLDQGESPIPIQDQCRPAVIDEYNPDRQPSSMMPNGKMPMQQEPGPVILPTGGMNVPQEPGPVILPTGGMNVPQEPGPVILPTGGMNVPQEPGPVILPTGGMNIPQEPGPVILPTGGMNVPQEPGPVILPTGGMNIPQEPGPVSLDGQSDDTQEPGESYLETQESGGLNDYKKVKILDEKPKKTEATETIDSISIELVKVAEKIKEIEKQGSLQKSKGSGIPFASTNIPPASVVRDDEHQEKDSQDESERDKKIEEESTKENKDEEQEEKADEKEARLSTEKVARELQRIINLLRGNKEFKQKANGVEEQIEKIRKLPQSHKFTQKSTIEKTIEARYMGQQMDEVDDYQEIEEWEEDTTPKNAVNFIVSHQKDEMKSSEAEKEVTQQEEVDYITEIDKKIREIEAKRKKEDE